MFLMCVLAADLHVFVAEERRDQEEIEDGATKKGAGEEGVGEGM